MLKVIIVDLDQFNGYVKNINILQKSVTHTYIHTQHYSAVTVSMSPLECWHTHAIFSPWDQSGGTQRGETCQCLESWNKGNDIKKKKQAKCQFLSLTLFWPFSWNRRWSSCCGTHVLPRLGKKNHFKLEHNFVRGCWVLTTPSKKNPKQNKKNLIQTPLGAVQ